MGRGGSSTYLAKGLRQVVHYVVGWGIGQVAYGLGRDADQVAHGPGLEEGHRSGGSWLLVRVTLVVDWLFLPRNFGVVVGAYEGLLPFC